MEVTYRPPQSWNLRANGEPLIWDLDHINPTDVDYINAVIGAVKERYCVRNGEVKNIQYVYPGTPINYELIKSLTLAIKDLQGYDWLTPEYVNEWNSGNLLIEPYNMDFEIYEQYRLTGVVSHYCLHKDIVVWLLHAKNLLNRLVSVPLNAVQVFTPSGRRIVSVGKSTDIETTGEYQADFDDAVYIAKEHMFYQYGDPKSYEGTHITQDTDYRYYGVDADQWTYYEYEQKYHDDIQAEPYRCVKTNRYSQYLYKRLRDNIDVSYHYANGLKYNTVFALLMNKTVMGDVYSFKCDYFDSAHGYESNHLYIKNYGYLNKDFGIQIGFNADTIHDLPEQSIPMSSNQQYGNYYHVHNGIGIHATMYLDYGVSGGFLFRPDSAMFPVVPNDPILDPIIRPYNPPPGPDPDDPSTPTYPPDTPFVDPPLDINPPRVREPFKTPWDFVPPDGGTKPRYPGNRTWESGNKPWDWDLPYYYSGGEWYGFFVNQKGQFVAKGSDVWVCIGWDYDESIYGRVFVYIGGMAGSSIAQIYWAPGVALSNLLILDEAHVYVGKEDEYHRLSDPDPAGADSYLTRVIIPPGNELAVNTTGAAKSITKYWDTNMSVDGRVCGFYFAEFPGSEEPDGWEPAGSPRAVAFNYPDTNMDKFEAQEDDDARAHFLSYPIPKGISFKLESFHHFGERWGDGTIIRDN